jgi:hypothetical protein
MSFTVGIFDLFSYVVPGILYVFVINEVLKLTGMSQLDLFQIKEASMLALVVVIAYIASMLLARLAKRWYRLWIRKAMDAEALHYLRTHHPDIRIEFQPEEWAFIFSALKQDYLELSNQLDREKALSQMLQNLSLGFSLLFLLEIFYVFYFHNASYLLACAGALAASASAMNGSRSFNMWYYREVFEQGLLYGNSLEALLSKVRSKQADEPTSKTKRKAA